MNLIKVIANELSVKEIQVSETVKLLDEGATIPFIARYRKERTGGLDEEVLRSVEERINYLKLLQERKETVIKSIEEQGKLTPELKTKIDESLKLQDIEDLYLPFKPKRKTRGTIAKAMGLEPLALYILDNPFYTGNIEDEALKYISEEKGVGSAEVALKGAQDIIAEILNESAEIRKNLREMLLEESVIVSEKIGDKKEDSREETEHRKKDVYEIYHKFSIEIKKIKPYQYLAINRGEREKYLKATLSFNKQKAYDIIYDTQIRERNSVFFEMLMAVAEDSFNRLVFPSLEREIRNHLTEWADNHAIEIFASNLKQLLLQPPISCSHIIGIDPGFYSGSKIAVIDATGKYLEGETIYPHPPQNRRQEAKQTLLKLISKYDADLIAIGNGTAGRETELMVAEIIKENNLKCRYIIVNEAGASVYSASPLAKVEFPDLEASQRGNISIARRVLDPLAELVKIDPKSIGVGLYQHDVEQKLLGKKLDDVVVSCVNYVGVDLNTASASLLTYVSGLNSRLASSIVRYRERKGRFTNRMQLMEVTGMGEKSFEQCAGFLKIRGGENQLDNTFIHPESYEAVYKLFSNLGVGADNAALLELKIKQKNPVKVSSEINIGIPTLNDIIENLKKPGRDPREELPKPILRSDVMKMEDLSEGMTLKGTVRNVVDFGAFVDIGVKQDALLHISQMANKFVKNPLDVLQVGDIIEIKVLSKDMVKGRISVTMKN